LDLDHIVRWVEPVVPDQHFTFWIAPATLVLDQAWNIANTFTASPQRHRRPTSSISAGDDAVRTTSATPLPPRTARIHEVLR
jgi:hypothetical protein